MQFPEPNHDSNNIRKTLDVEALGKPGEIVVLPLKERRRRLIENQTRNETQHQDTLPLFMDAVEKEKHAKNRPEFIELLNDMRPHLAPGDTLSKEDWISLRSAIEESFTLSQLTTYLSKYSKTETDINRDGDMGLEGNHRSWRPGTGDYMDVAADPEADESERKLTGKRLLAERVLRECWQLGIVDEIGQLDIHLQPRAISLLLHSEQCSFEELALTHSVKIDVTKSAELVTVTGTQRACESVRRIIEEFVSQIQQESMDLSFVHELHEDHGDVSETQFIEWMNKSYGVDIEKEPGVPNGTVHYPADSKGTVDRARRDLEFALLTKQKTSVPFTTYLLPSMSASTYTAYPDGAVSWVDKSKPWFRWCVPHQDIDHDEQPPLFRQQYPTLPADILKLLRGTSLSQINEDFEETMTAVVGTCLFLRKPEVTKATMSAPELGKSSSPHVFIETIPKQSSFLERLLADPSHGSHNTYRFRLTPSIKNPHPLPVLELEIGLGSVEDDSWWISSESDFFVRRLKSLTREDSLDFLLPESDFDVRFTRTLARNLLTSFVGYEDDLLVALREQLQHVATNPHVSLPAYCYIPLPRALIDSKDGSEVDREYRPEEKIVGQYLFPPFHLFSGGEFRVYNFGDHKVTYTHHENSPIIAEQTSRLSLDMDLRADERDPFDETTNVRRQRLERRFKDFYHSACKLAFQLGMHGMA